MAFQRFLSRPSLRPLSTASWKRGRDADRFANMAISEDLRTRAAYKLAAMNSGARHFLRQGSCVVDLGAAPGGWALVAADAVRLDASRADARVWGRASRVRDEPPPPVRRTAGGQQRQRKFGEDMEPIPGAKFIKGDFMDREIQAEIRRSLRGCEADVVLSDMAPSTTGDPNLNHDRIMLLAEKAADVALTLLRSGGVFVCKIFNGAGEKAFREALRQDFLKVKAVKPEASKKTSREMFYIASGFVPRHLRDPPVREVGDVSTSAEDRMQDADVIAADYKALWEVRGRRKGKKLQTVDPS